MDTRSIFDAVYHITVFKTAYSVQVRVCCVCDLPLIVIELSFSSHTELVLYHTVFFLLLFPYSFKRKSVPLLYSSILSQTLAVNITKSESCSTGRKINKKLLCGLNKKGCLSFSMKLNYHSLLCQQL